MPCMGLHEDIDPSSARNAAELVALMRGLHGRSGLSYRRLERRAAEQGRVLTRSTISYVLTRPSLPRPEMLAAFVAACGHERETAAWLDALERLTAGPESGSREAGSPAAATGPPAPPATPEPAPRPAPKAVPGGRLRQRRLLLVIGAVVAALGLGYWLVKGVPGAATSLSSGDVAPSATPAKRPATGFTLFEGRSQKGMTAASVGYRFWDTGDGWFGIEYVTPYSRDEPDAHQDGWGGKLRMHYEDRFGAHTVDLTDNPDGEPDAGKDDIRYGLKNVWFEVCDSDGRAQLRGCQRLRKART
ncbi:hypothetical protein ADK53_18690 [Streptomyces sp. WM6373]|nr:hypothetical protein ADK53_18690 [Streptomyces sp. WM6373]KOU74093.1 hypothetical protein ADK96_04370 [Streptomyces sp. IGB124]KOU76889.1 hypothetical protein ADK61_13835 [Streptomyces sp. XY66]KOU86440.1 hypothetical protein ADK93_20430 [Streptomyces sp. XY58]KOV06143.1 hypothetical protein ADK89_16760 [Streptomyces sp. XY37]KOV17135.1 hypothetical protein ADK90_25570 [Streptomyces sp. XY413]KOV31930.1 hypothetical protein ADK97_24260 [Streptomyces sp. H021]KOV48491.1 hypothetical protei